jgi:Flp pilus assembly protein TadD
LYLVRAGRNAEARREIHRARQLEPASLVIASSVPFTDMVDGNYASAIDTARAVLARDTTFAIAYTGLASSLSQAGRHDEAVRVAQQALAFPGLRPTEAQGVLAYALARAGRAAEARRMLAELEAAPGGQHPAAGVVAATWMELGDRNKALAVLKDAVEQHDPWLLNYGRTQRYAKLRADSRGKALLESTERQ